MERRLELHQILRRIPGIKGVYFNPPPTVKMSYPCIRYKWSSENPVFADNYKYKHEMRYSLTVIDPNPESSVAKAVLALPYSRLETSYAADNLSHFQFTLFY